MLFSNVALTANLSSPNMRVFKNIYHHIQRKRPAKDHVTTTKPSQEDQALSSPSPSSLSSTIVIRNHTGIPTSTALPLHVDFIREVADSFHHPDVLDVKRRIRVIPIVNRFLGGNISPQTTTRSHHRLAICSSPAVVERSPVDAKHRLRTFAIAAHFIGSQVRARFSHDDPLLLLPSANANAADPTQSVMPPVRDVKHRLRVLAIVARFIGILPSSRHAPASSTEPVVQMSDFVVLGVLGSGSFAKVFRVRDKTSGRISALKVIEKAALTSWWSWSLFEGSLAFLVFCKWKRAFMIRRTTIF
jgi:hypothetical protein